MCQAFDTPGCMSEWLNWAKPSPKNGSVFLIISRKYPRSSGCVTSSLMTTPSILGMRFSFVGIAYRVLFGLQARETKPVIVNPLRTTQYVKDPRQIAGEVRVRQHPARPGRFCSLAAG